MNAIDKLDKLKKDIASLNEITQQECWVDTHKEGTGKGGFVNIEIFVNGKQSYHDNQIIMEDGEDEAWKKLIDRIVR